MEISEIKKKLISDIEFLRSPEGYIRAGYPRFFTLFGRDSIITAWQLLDYDPEIAKNTLIILSDFQGTEVDNEKEEEPGKILHEWWGDVKSKIPEKKPGFRFPFPYYGSIDSTFLYLILIYLYLEKTGDWQLIGSLNQNIVKAAEWILNFSDKDENGLIDFERKNPNGLRFQGWRDSSSNQERVESPIELVEIQGYAYFACVRISAIIKSLGHGVLSEKLLEKAADIKTKFSKSFWWKDEKFFYFELDKNKNPQKIVTSNPGHLLFTGLIAKPEIDSVVARIFKEDMRTSYGIRTQSTLSDDFRADAYQKGSVWPHDNWIIAEGLRMNGFNEQYLMIKNALLKIFSDTGKISELCAVDTDNKLIESQRSNDIQAWSSGALLSMIINDN